MTEEEQRDKIQQYIDAYNAFDAEGMMRHLGDDIIFQNVVDGEVTLTVEGIREFRRQAEAATRYFRERQQAITGWEFAGKRVAVAIDYRAVAAVNLPNGPRAGETVRLAGRSEFTFEGGKIVLIRDSTETA